MKQMGSDPDEGEERVPCKDCGRATTMTATKLCDYCWERRRRPSRFTPRLKEI